MTVSVKPPLKTNDLIKAMLALNAAGNRATLTMEGNLVSEPINGSVSDGDAVALVNWKRPS